MPVTPLITAGLPDTISFGRPVLPPDVGAFSDAAMRGSSGPLDRLGSGSKPSGTDGLPPASSRSTPTSRDGSASSMIAWRSTGGSRCEIGCGVAPTFQVAIVASTNSIPFGSPIVTKLSGVTPSAW